jgi:hypothetical protein
MKLVFFGLSFLLHLILMVWWTIGSAIKKCVGLYTNTFAALRSPGADSMSPPAAGGAAGRRRVAGTRA